MSGRGGGWWESSTEALSSQPLRMEARLHQSGGQRQRHFPCLKRIAGVPGDRRLSAAAASLTGSSTCSDPWSSRAGLSLAGLD